jgi:hypothetical protein
MRKILLFLPLILITSIVGILGNSIVSPSNAQNTIEINKIQIESSPVDLVKIIHDNEPLIKVEYQSGSTVVLKVDDLLLLTKGTLAPFWHAIDIVKNEGYSLEHFIESSMGSKENPTRIYAILER